MSSRKAKSVFRLPRIQSRGPSSRWRLHSDLSSLRQPPHPPHVASQAGKISFDPHLLQPSKKKLAKPECGFDRREGRLHRARLPRVDSPPLLTGHLLSHGYQPRIGDLLRVRFFRRTVIVSPLRGVLGGDGNEGSTVEPTDSISSAFTYPPSANTRCTVPRIKRLSPTSTAAWAL